ncbi:transporter, DASS family [Dictyocaulus viviparus]|uniref:Transporter, DASS family n=1 Tax=Dictyocaulus viviparus TaxID=29172 RepID=A0A0D8XB14_DICVI|nr:transporter, DASS family [Dictyocaulus viviparus]
MSSSFPLSKQSSEEKRSAEKESVSIFMSGVEESTQESKSPTTEITIIDEFLYDGCPDHQLVAAARLFVRGARKVFGLVRDGAGQQEMRCAFCVCIVAVYWMTEALPLAATAMFPVVLYPLTGVMTPKDVAQQYINDTNFLFIGGLIVAVAIENCNLHKRLALFVLNNVGSNPKCMFISNTATTAMMVPLAQSLIHELVTTYEKSEYVSTRDPNGLKQMSIGMVLCISISANIGGTGMLTGTPSNLILVGQLPELFGSEASMDYVQYMVFAFPLMCFCLTAAWAMLTVLFLNNAPPRTDRVSRLLQKKYRDLPRMSFDEKTVIAAFVLLLFLWIFKDPGFMPGYGRFLRKGYFSDTTSVMIIAIILFALPKEKPDLCDCTIKGMKRSPALIDWPVTQSHVPWNVVLLLGGGFALAAGVKDSGLSAMIGRSLSTFNDFPLWVSQLFTMTITLIITNFCSNVSTATIFVPLVATMATEIEVHPFNLMLPVTIMASFTFILPAGTAPNAIVFGSGMVTVSDMAGSGAVLSILCLIITLLYMKTVAPIVLPLAEFPTWARLRNSSGNI